MNQNLSQKSKASMFLWLIVFVLASCFCTNWYLKLKKINALTRKWPEPPSMPFIGHIHHILRFTKGNPFINGSQLIRQYAIDHRLKVCFGTKLFLFDCNPKDLPKILSAPQLLEKSDEYDVFRNWLGEGLFTSKVDPWTQQRRLLSPVFGYGMLDRYMDICDKHAKILVSNLKVYADQGLECDFFKLVSLCTLDIICETALGINPNMQISKQTSYIDAVHTLHKILTRRMFNPFYRNNVIYAFSNHARREKEALAVLHGFSERLIQMRRNEMLSSDECVPDDAKHSFLAALLTAQITNRKLSDKAIRNEVDTIIFGGFDTTATALKFFIYNMTKAAESQKKCRQEIYEICGNDRDMAITIRQLRQMEYVEMCIKETLRLYPPGPLVARKALANCDINGLVIPAGCTVIISPIYMGHCDEFFPHANTFKPSRFARQTTNASTAIPYTFLPFAAGQRSCIGQKLALLIIKMIAAHLLRDFQFKAVNDISEYMLPLKYSITLQTRRPLLCKVCNI